MRLLLSLLALPCLASATDPKPALRLLRDDCLGCHKPGKAKGGLLLTSREKILAGGDSGASIVPGKSAESLLYQVLLEDGDPHMPPKKQFSETEIAAFRSWIDGGAHWDASVFDELPPPKPVSLTSLPVSYQPVLALALSPDEKLLAAATGPRVNLYDVSKPERPMIGSLSGHLEAVQSLLWTEDGKQLVTGGFRQIRIWDAATFKEIGRIETTFIGPITALALHKDQLFAADGEPGGAGFIHQIDLTNRKILRTWKAHDDSLYSLRLSADGQLLASAAADKLAKIWRTADGQPVSFYEGHTNHVLAVAFNHNASQLATAGADREIKVWDVKSREQDVVLGDKKTVFTALTWTPDGKALIGVTEKGTGAIFTELQKHDGAQRSDTGKQVKLASVGAMLYSTVASKDAKTLFAGGDDGRIWIWDGSGKNIAQIQP